MPIAFFLLLVVMVHSKPTTTYRTVSDLPSGSGTHTHHVLPDGHHRIVQNVHHVFPDGKYLKLHSNVTHSPHWVFVLLDAFNMTCDGEATLTVRHPPPDLVETLSASKPEDVILHASHHFKCNNSIIFRRVEAFTMEEDGKRIVIRTRTARYWDVFQHAMVHYDTDYYDQSHHHPTPNPTVHSHPQNHHAMKPLWGWGIFKKIGDFITSTYNAVKTAITDNKGTIAFVAKALVTGEVNIDDTRQIINAQFSYNKDVSKTVEKWDINAEAKVAGSASAILSVQFVLSVKNYALVLVRAEAKGSVNVAVRVEGSFISGVDKDLKTQVALIKLTTISFTIGNIAIVIMPSVPIIVGCKVDVDATANMVITTSGSGTINVGFQYDGKTYTPIQKQTLTFVAPEIKAANFTGLVTVAPFVEPTFIVNIDLIGGLTSTMRVTGEAIMAYDTTDAKCSLNVIVNVHVLITVGATLEITIASFKVVPVPQKSFGPWTVFSNKYPVYSKCLFKSKADLLKPGWGTKAHHFKALDGPGFTEKDIGRVYTGSMVGNSTCGFDGRFISLQIASVTDYDVTFVGSVSTDAGTSLSSQQMTYTMATNGGSQAVTFTPISAITWACDDAIKWASTTNDGNASYVMNTPFSGNVKSDRSAITLAGTCANLTLSTIMDAIEPTTGPTSGVTPVPGTPVTATPTPLATIPGQGQGAAPTTEAPTVSAVPGWLVIAAIVIGILVLIAVIGFLLRNRKAQKEKEQSDWGEASQTIIHPSVDSREAERPLQRHGSELALSCTEIQHSSTEMS